jgi:hypothetical protein
VRYNARIDKSQPAIVKALRQMGYSVALQHDDILVGWAGKTYWYEIKTPTATGKIAYAGGVSGKKTKSKQQELKDNWRGHYRIVSTLEQILEDLK